MMVVEAFSISTNARVEEATERAEEIETEDLHIIVTEITGESDDEGKVVYDI